MNKMRRALLKAAGGASTVAAGFAAGILGSLKVFAAGWNESGFDSKAMADALTGVSSATIALWVVVSFGAGVAWVVRRTRWATEP